MRPKSSERTLSEISPRRGSKAPRGGFPPPGAIGLAADRCAFPRSACHFFDHGRGRVCGLAVSTGLILARPREARRFFRECRKIAGRSVRRSEGFRRVESGDLEGFARGVIHWKFPSLHLDELEGPGAMALRQVLVRPEIHRLTVTLEDVRGWTDDDIRIAQDRVRKLIDLDPRTLCSPCLMLVNFVAHQAERKLEPVARATPNHDTATGREGCFASQDPPGDGLQVPVTTGTALQSPSAQCQAIERILTAGKPRFVNEQT